MKKFFNEFKEFAVRGNVMDMAIGVVIGTAFGKITTSLVNDVFMPLILDGFGGFLLGAWPLRFAADRDGLRCWHFIVGVFTALPPRIVRSSRRIPLPPVLGAG